VPAIVSPFTSFGQHPRGRHRAVGRDRPAGNHLRRGAHHLLVCRLIISGLTVTSDDTQIQLRLLINGSEVSGASDYQWGMRQTGGTSTTVFDSSDSEIALTPDGANLNVGNASTKSYSGVVTVFDPASALHKVVHHKGTWVDPPGNYRSTVYAGGALQNSGAITGFKVFGSSNLTGGTVVCLGVA
jgi:hypothetical protein